MFVATNANLIFIICFYFSKTRWETKSGNLSISTIIRTISKCSRNISSYWPNSRRWAEQFLSERYFIRHYVRDLTNHRFLRKRAPNNEKPFSVTSMDLSWEKCIREAERERRSCGSFERKKLKSDMNWESVWWQGLVQTIISTGRPKSSKSLLLVKSIVGIKYIMRWVALILGLIKFLNH